MTKKQKRWFYGAGAVAVGGTAAALVIAKPNFPAAARDLVKVFRGSPVVQAANRKLWKHTGLRLIPKEVVARAGVGAAGGAAAGVVAGQSAEEAAGHFARFKRSIRENYRILTRADARDRLQRYKANIVKKRMAPPSIRQLGAAPRGAWNLQMVDAPGEQLGGRKTFHGQFVQAVTGSGEKKGAALFASGSQLHFARKLRDIKGSRAYISEANVNRLIDQRNAMKVPISTSVSPVTIGHHGGEFAGNPAGMATYSAQKTTTNRKGRKISAEAFARQQERTLRNLGPQMRANLKAKEEKVAQNKFLTKQRKTVVGWLRGGYTKSNIPKA